MTGQRNKPAHATGVSVTVNLSPAEALALTECTFTCTSAQRWRTAEHALAKVKDATQRAQERRS